MAHPERGVDIMQQFASMCGDICTIEKQPNIDGRNMIMFLVAAKPGK